MDKILPIGSVVRLKNGEQKIMIICRLPLYNNEGTNQYLFNFIISFVGFSVPMGLLCSVLFYSLLKGLILGFFGGSLFAGLICGFVKILSVRKNKLKERYEIKGSVLYEGAANYLADTETVGGWIFLMEDRLCFVAHSFNFMAGQRIILYSDIIKVTKGKMIRSIVIHLCNNKVEQFIVNNRKKWIEIIEDGKKQQYKTFMKKQITSCISK